jgi:5-methylcytosine-specific restriction endonuclease McrA
MQMLKAQEFRCSLTGVVLTPETARLDHVVPVSQGGTDDIENLQWVHMDANAAKGTMDQDQFILLCRRVAAYRG